jgi:hypothetical protein
MKKSIFLTVLLSGFGLTSYSQMTTQCNINTLIAGGGNNFEIIGEESNLMVDSLFSNLPNTKRKGYKWKFKNIIIPGIDTPLSFQVHQGMRDVKIMEDIILSHLQVRIIKQID